jgi:hypothetical protein
MASLLGRVFIGEGGMPLGTVDPVSTRKMWEKLGLLSSGRVGSIDDDIKSTTLALFRGRVGLTDDLTRETTLALFGGRVGLTDDVMDQPLWHSSEEEWD